MQSADIPMCNNVKVNSESLNQQSRGMPNHNRNTDKDLLLANFDLKIDNLSNQEKSELENCLFENKDIFVTKENPSLGLTTLIEHQIHLKPDAKSKHQRPYKLPPDKREVLRHQLNELLKQGILTPVSEREDVPITSPIVLISKRRKVKVGVKPGSKEESLSMYRFVVAFRFLNTQTQDFWYAIPDVHELIKSSFTHITPNYMSSIDLHSGFFQMKIAQESTKYTAFNTCFGTHKFQRLPQGMKSSPNSFQLLMDKVLNGLSFKTTLCYMDDVIVVSETFSQHMKDLKEVFDRISNAELKLSPSKCQFAQKRCVFLGHEISKEGIRPPPDRINAIKDFTEQKTAKQLQRFLGLMNWFRKFIRGFSAITKCLYKLVKKVIKFQWEAEHQHAFDELKSSLINSEALAFPRYDLPFYVSVDRSSKGIGYMLYQKHPSTEYENEKVRVVRFGSKSLTNYQQAYGPTKLELLGMVTSILDCSSYLRGRSFIVECDHQALKPLFQKQLKGAIYERWLAILQEFDFEIRYKPAEQMVVADVLSRCQQNSQKNAELSPDESDNCFPYVKETHRDIKLPNGTSLEERLHNREINQNIVVNHVVMKPRSNIPSHCGIESAYDADTEDDKSIRRDKSRVNRRQRQATNM